jgi:hypothetical protein
MFTFGVILVALLGLLGCLGLALLVAGVRGVVVPVRRECRSCRFDLAGLGDRIACPECGRQLVGANAVRMVSRARRPRWALAGLGMLAFSLAIPAAAAVDSLWTGRLSSGSPTWLLAAEVHVLGWRTPQSVARELASRAAAGQVDRSTLASLARAISVMHPGQHVADELTDLVGMAATSGAINKETVARHMVMESLFETDVPARLRPDEPIVRSLISYSDSETRVPRDGVWWLRKRISAILVDGHRYTSMIPSTVEETQRWAPLVSRTPGCVMGSGMYPVVCGCPAVPAQPRLAIGRHRVTLEYEVEACNGLGDASPTGVSVSRTYDLEVVLPDAPLVELIDDSRLKRQIIAELTPYVTRAVTPGVVPMCQIGLRSESVVPKRPESLSRKSATLGGAWTVLIDFDGAVEPVGTFRVGWRADGTRFAASAPQRAKIPADSHKCRVILRPCESLAVTREAIDVMPAGDIVFDDVWVR